MADDDQEFSTAWEKDHARFEDLADELKLEDDDRDGFITSSMKRKGYQQRTVWADPEPDDKGKDGGDYFSARRGAREKRQVNSRGRGQYDS